MKTYLTTCLVALCAAVACATEVPVTIEVDKPVTRIVRETVEVEATREVDVTREVPVTRVVEATRRVEVTRNVPVTREVTVTREVPVTREVEVTRVVEATRQVNVTREVPVTRVVVETVEVPVTRTVQVTREVPVTRVIELVREVPVTIESQSGRTLPPPRELCDDYPYMIRITETLRDFFGESADAAARGLQSYVTDVSGARSIRDQADSDRRDLVSNWYGACGVSPFPLVYRTREMSTPEGRGVCRVAVRAMIGEYTTFSNNVEDDDATDAFLAFTNAYANHCDNSFGR